MNASGAKPAVTVAGVTKRFAAVTALDGITFQVGSGELFGLIGPDGAGKTTMLRILAGVMAADSGTVRVENVDVVARPEDVRERISYMPQRFGLYEDLTVEENIRFFAEVFAVPRRVREERSTSLLAASGMLRFRKHLAGQLSGGMKQKLGLTCALVHAPRIVLLDEPTTGVDPVSRREFWQILYGLRAEGASIVISTAYLDEADRCDRLALMHNGELPYCESPDALRARMPGGMLEVATSVARAARDILLSVPGVRNVLIVGDGVHVHVDDARKRMPDLERALAVKGLEHGPVHEIMPSIEDLFVALLGHAPSVDARARIA
jgi:ABC-2 type transport system ATP-binding protein